MKDYREREIIEGGKLRRIQVIPMKDRIAGHASMALVDRHLRKRFIQMCIRDSYTTDRDTYDAEAGKYAFEGRDSWLWNLVLANLDADLRCV